MKIHRLAPEKRVIFNRSLLLQEVPGVLYLEETVPTKILPVIWVQPFPDAKLVWYIYQHVAIFITVNVTVNIPVPLSIWDLMVKNLKVDGFLIHKTQSLRSK